MSCKVTINNVVCSNIDDFLNLECVKRHSEARDFLYFFIDYILAHDIPIAKLYAVHNGNEQTNPNGTLSVYIPKRERLKNNIPQMLEIADIIFDGDVMPGWIYTINNNIAFKSIDFCKTHIERTNKRIDLFCIGYMRIKKELEEVNNNCGIYRNQEYVVQFCGKMEKQYKERFEEYLHANKFENTRILEEIEGKISKRKSDLININKKIADLSEIAKCDRVDVKTWILKHERKHNLLLRFKLKIKNLFIKKQDCKCKNVNRRATQGKRLLEL